MDKSKVIQVIHAADTEQHLGYLKKILDGLKAEDRITSYSSLESSTINETTFANFGADDMVIMLLTNAIVEHKATIEQWLLDLKKQNPQSKIAEVLVDNVPYETKLAVLPENLQPIRASEDMDGAWERIAVSLKKLFPKPAIKPLPDPIPPTPPSKPVWKKYLPYILVALTMVILGYFLYEEFKLDKEKTEVVEEASRVVEPPEPDRISSTYTDIEKRRVIQFNKISENYYMIEEPGTSWPWKGEAKINGNELIGWARFPNSQASMDVKGRINNNGSINVRYEFITKGDGTPANGRVDNHVWFPVD